MQAFMVVGRQTKDSIFGLIELADNELSANTIRNSIIWNGGFAAVIPNTERNNILLDELIADTFLANGEIE